MGFFHGRVQLEFGALLLAFVKANQLGGIVCTETLCRTNKQSRRPDVAYLSSQQVEKYGKTDFMILPECFPLIAEVVSPTDTVDDVFTKTEEYLESGAEEVWLLFPRTGLIMTANLDAEKIKWNLSNNQDLATLLKVLPGFSERVEELIPVYKNISTLI